MSDRAAFRVRRQSVRSAEGRFRWTAGLHKQEVTSWRGQCTGETGDWGGGVGVG